MKFFDSSFKIQDMVHIVPRVIVAIILAQTLPFKYMGDEESVWIFTQINMEPWGRYMIAIFETIAVIFLISRYYIIGAIISLSIITTANFLHIVKLGIIIQNDGGLLFALSIIVVVCSLWIVVFWNQERTLKKGQERFDFLSEMREAQKAEKLL